MEGRQEDVKSSFMKLQNGSDVRGVALAMLGEAQNLFPSTARQIGAAFVFWLAEKTGKSPESLRIGLGHDSRVTANSLTAGAAAGILEEGAKAYVCGLATTPAMFLSTVLEESAFDGAVMVTASHLPFNRNGLKFFTRSGGLGKNAIAEILELAAFRAEATGPAMVPLEDMERTIASLEERLKEAGELDTSPDICQNLPGEMATFDLAEAYCRHMRGIICREVEANDREHPLSGLHIVVDAGNGAAGFFATRILEPLGADTRGSVFLDPDGMFPNHVPNPENADAMAAISKAVVDAGADLGVIFDCDGDRAAVVFSDGREVNRNALIALMAAIISERHPKSVVVTDSVTSDELTEFLEKKLGLRHFRYRRGYKNVIDRANALCSVGQDCQLAMETSGHGALRENYFSDDGAYLCVKIICEMARLHGEGRRIEELIADLGAPAEEREVRIRILGEHFAAYGQQVLDSFGAFARRMGWKVVEPNYEGVRVAFDDEEVKGWLLLRLSLHDPILPLNLETAKKGGTAILLDRIRPFLAKHDRLVF